MLSSYDALKFLIDSEMMSIIFLIILERKDNEFTQKGGNLSWDIEFGLNGNFACLEN